MLRKYFAHSYTLAFLAGFFSLSLEILGTEITFAFFARSSEAMALALTAFLCGLSLGSWITQRFNAYLLNEFENVMAFSFLILACFAGPVLGNFDSLQVLLSGGFASAEPTRELWKVLFVFLCFLNLFLPAILIGLIFPLANDKAHRETSVPTGKVNLIDLFGAAIGAVSAGFLMIPILGLGKSFALLSVCSLIVGLVLNSWKRKTHIVIGVISIFAVASYASTYLRGETKMRFRSGETILFQENSKFGVVSVVRLEASKDKYKTLYINYRPMCNSAAQFSVSEQNLAGYMASAEAEAESVLGIGLGCGMTAAQILHSYPKANLDIVEINEQVVEANAKHFSSENKNVLKNPRVHLILDDGFVYLNRSNKKYQRILIDIEEPTIIQSSALYTIEGMSSAKKSLTSDGILGLWSFYQRETAKIILNTMRTNFKYVEVRVEEGFLLFFASDVPLPNAPSKNPSAALDIEAIPLKIVASIKDNPYPRYYDVNQVMGLSIKERDPFEIKQSK